MQDDETCVTVISQHYSILCAIKSENTATKIIYNIIKIITMARQPYMGLGLLFPRLRGLCAFAAVRDRPTGRAFQLDPDVTARAIWQSVRRLG